MFYSFGDDEKERRRWVEIKGIKLASNSCSIAHGSWMLKAHINTSSATLHQLFPYPQFLFLVAHKNKLHHGGIEKP